jgi:hypothetical protein
LEDEEDDGEDNDIDRLWDERCWLWLLMVVAVVVELSRPM